MTENDGIAETGEFYYVEIPVEVESGMVEYVENTENVTVNVPVVTEVEVGVGVEATRTAPAPSGN